MLRAAGCHGSAPAHLQPADLVAVFLRIDTPTRSELIAQSHTVDEINQYLTSDSLAYLSLQRQRRGRGRQRAAPRARQRRPSALAPTRNWRGTAFSLPMAQPTSSAGNASVTPASVATTPCRFQDSPKPRQMRLLDFLNMDF
jgi:hypothetical protein